MSKKQEAEKHAEELSERIQQFGESIICAIYNKSRKAGELFAKMHLFNCDSIYESRKDLSYEDRIEILSSLIKLYQEMIKLFESGVKYDKEFKYDKGSKDHLH